MILYRNSGRAGRRRRLPWNSGPPARPTVARPRRRRKTRVVDVAPARRPARYSGQAVRDGKVGGKPWAPPRRAPLPG